MFIKIELPNASSLCRKLVNCVNEVLLEISDISREISVRCDEVDKDEKA